MTAQEAADLYRRGATFQRIAQDLGITQRAAIDGVMAILELDHCPRCGQLKKVVAEKCEDCEREGMR